MIPSFVFDKYKEVSDAFIRELGVPCKLVYLSDGCTCSSGNLYAGTTPLQERCYYCQTGDPIENTEEILLRVYTDQKKWIKPYSPDASAQIVGFLSDLPKLRTCNFLYINTPQEGLLRQKFKLAGEIRTQGFLHDRYFIAELQRIV